MTERPPSSATPSSPDPAAEAIAYHLRELRRMLDEARQHSGASGSGVGRSLAARVRSGLGGDGSIPIDEHLVDALEAIDDRLSRLAEWHQADHLAVGDVQGEVLRISAAADDAGQALQLGADRADEHERRLDDLDRRLRELRSMHELLVRHLDERADDAAASPAATPSGATPPPPAVAHLRRAALDDFYQDLETRFRGDRDHVTGLLEAYLPDVLAAGGPVLDIGCGRGEWLSLLAEHDVAAYGVDLNDTFAQANRDRGLDVRTGDAIAHLAEREPEALGVITGFHIAEHLPFEVLVDLADHALRALRPGGLLILESPNPTNVRVGAAQFWIDPTHLRPLHPELLRFVLDQRGFASTEIRPLHPAAHFDLDWAAALGDHATAEGRAMLEEIRTALCGPMDYAVIATKGLPAD